MKIFSNSLGELNLIPFNPSEDASEEMAYSVGVVKTIDGGEYRFLGSELPEREKNLRYTVSSQDANLIREAIQNGLSGNWAVPSFEHQRKLPETLGLTDCHYLFNGIDLGELVFFILINESGISLQYSLLLNITPSIAGAIIVPCQIGYIDGDVSTTKGIGGSLSLSVRYIITELMSSTERTYPQYKGYNLVNSYFFTNLSEKSTNYSQEKIIGDGEFGVKLNYGSEWARPETTYRVNFMAKNDLEVAEFKRFMQTVKGSFTPFWRANTDIPMFPDINGFEVSVTDNGFLHGLDYLDLAFFNGDEWSSIAIASKSNADGVTTFTMSQEPPQDAYICYFLCLQRLSNSGCSINWTGNGTADCSFSVLNLVRVD